ncbi:unnamed protein product [Mytilus coruscus]|uniref:Uncharacterized protein n=1 Tax=Mytilus coruscus TaxID=42192 RepID=A0A6J8EN63_MYTCO|nr:unnamed protein product [Mytilus coruscus]
MEISWLPVLVPGQIYDYEVGLSPTSGSSAPDLLAFQSTKQHAHYLIIHSNIPDGTRFFIAIKTISKSNIEGITDHRLLCSEDIDVQMSLNSIKAYWTLPEDIQTYTFDALFAIERRSSLTISTEGVMVMSSPPATGAITLQHLNLTTGLGTEKLLVTFDQFYDPDIENTTEKYDAVQTYEYAITDNSMVGKMYTPWTIIKSQTTDNHKISFEVPLTGEMDFSRCKRFTIRGYNKAKHYSVVSTEIKDCTAYNPILINPNIVKDAVGQPDIVDGIGRTIYLTKNDYWLEADQD